MSEAKNIHHQIMSLIGKLDNGSHSSSQLQAVDMEIYKLFCNYLAEKDKEIERLQKRDGNAKIELCYDDGNNPNARSTCKHLDFGVCDNQYVVESELLNKTLAELTRWKDMCDKMATSLDEVIDVSIPDDNDEAYCIRDRARELLSAYNAIKSGEQSKPTEQEAGK